MTLNGKIVGLVLASALLCVGASAQSLGEVAKQKSAKKAARVITNDDIPSRPAEEAKPATEAPASDAAATEAKTKDDAAAVSSEGEGEKDSVEVAQLKGQLAELDKTIADRQKRTDAYRDRMANETDSTKKEIQTNVLGAMESDLKNLGQQRSDLLEQIEKQKERDKQKAGESQTAEQ